jgi:hypothetical protein
MGEFRPLYCLHCGQTLFSDDLDKCSACRKTGGMRDPAAPDALGDIVERKRQEPSPALLHSGSVPDALQQVAHGYWIFKVTITGLAFMFLGIFLLTSPAMRDDPRSLSLGNAIYGVVVILIGFGILVLPFLRFAQRRRPTGKEDDKVGPG